MFVFQKLSSKTVVGCHQIPTAIGSLSRFRRSASPTPNVTLYDYQNHSLEIFEIEEESDSLCTSLYFLLDFCHLYYIPSIILLGLVGNLLSCVVFLKTHLKLRSSSYYLAALATTDFSFLMSLLLVWLNSTIGWKVFNNNGWCETLVYVSAVCSSLSVWLIVAFTVERFIAVQYPLHRPHMCTVARAKTIILVLTILALVSHSYSFITAGVVKNQGGDEVCELKIEYLETMQIISIIDSIASLIVPLVLIIVMNTMIMRNLLKFGRRFNQDPGYTTNCPNREKSDINLNQIPSANSSNNGGAGNMNLVSLVGTNGTRRPPSQQSSSFHSSKNHSRHQPASAPPSTPRNACQMTEIEAPCIHVRSSCRNLGSTRFNQESITKMLVLISTVFILLNLPSYVIRLCVFFFALAKKNTPETLWCLQQFFMLLYYTNFSINFLLYAMCGITFRRCLEQILRRLLKSMTRYHCSPQRESVSP
ncbi:PREDICTED: thyrotropin-releasing hormone receptor-like [Wasmannia auropunctata]|uniref:thyrotropin-releasing hormone receptor-like n=1 Tax=Wasmannia auropunctata TaxID=64793 RepID=UPI0005EF3FC8|nr:PREDICTED: thyrotropin-releasing hormone receptor-like [Wasmannia auropunctata]XP_011707079.1 PREDICTED: thyrotropin-releasing hormone receptor-like [Wasmannia auropunctata]XP_011707080.1 PREDICTED: thyrotropin-releasing hormone receptor-like [Wasmannia auropunctata]XP_011707081.1 PREDICTED: thyrotropin-releasing hormone receptor-like [Wasmannia auropunctata]XP_011707082.1 PREDICTED: thyrotropin-releasing hormone receptor-like [Wasmannia auropunctata]